MDYSPEKSANYLQLVLLRFEIEHIKGILKGTAAKLTAEQKLAKIHFAVEDQLQRHFVIEDAAKASTVTQVVQTFKGTDYWSPLSMGLKSYEQNGSTASLDVFIDKYYYEKIYETFESLPKKEKKYAKFYASMDNDSFTLLTLVRGKILNFDPNWLRLVVPQNYFNLKKQTVEALVSAADYEAAMKIVLGTPYSRYFNRAQDPQETVANAEKAFNKAILQHAKASQIREIFNIGLVLSFLTQKEAEIHNLAVVCLGVEGAMKPEDIRSQFLL
jgi:vacuolar-type H+-ATPase subunit C/Vma6